MLLLHFLGKISIFKQFVQYRTIRVTPEPPRTDFFLVFRKSRTIVLFVAWCLLQNIYIHYLEYIRCNQEMFRKYGEQCVSELNSGNPWRQNTGRRSVL